MIDIVNLKIRSNESFKNAHKNKIYTHIFIEIISIFTNITALYVTCCAKRKQSPRLLLYGSPHKLIDLLLYLGLLLRAG
jgi:hypothetical protein